jgi:PIN domain nuclease of toxin-antitoxin system
MNSRVLVDTHAFIWWDSVPEELPDRVLSLMKDPLTELLVSCVSIWEMQIKQMLGKLNMEMPISELIETQQQNGIHILDINLQHIFSLEDVPHIHKDPFDRMLVSQALYEKIPIITNDIEIKKYHVTVIW